MTLYQIDPALSVGTFAVETFPANGVPLRVVRASSVAQLQTLIAYERDFPPMLLRDRDPRYEPDFPGALTRALAVA